MEPTTFSSIGIGLNSTANVEDTEDGSFSTTTTVTIILRTLSIIIAVSLVVVSNVINLVILPRVKCFGEVTKFLLRSLAVTDLMIGISLIVAICPAIIDYWPYGDALCKFIGSAGTLLATASSLTLMCISIDRYLAVTKPLRYISVVTLPRARFVVSIVWSTCVIFIATVVTATWPPFQNIHYDSILCNCIVKFFDGKVFPRALGAAAVCVLIPSVVISVTNSRLLMISIGHAKRIHALPGHRAGGQNHRISTKELKAVKTTLTITGIYYVAWTPFITTQIYQAISPTPVADWLHFLAGYLVICNSWWNVFIYCFMNRMFMEKLKELLNSKCKCHLNTMGSEDLHSAVMTDTNESVT